MDNTLRKKMITFLVWALGFIVPGFFLYEFAILRYDSLISELNGHLSLDSTIKIRIIESQITEKLRDFSLISGDPRVNAAINRFGYGSGPGNDLKAILAYIGNAVTAENITYITPDLRTFLSAFDTQEKNDTVKLKEIISSIPPEIQSLCSDDDIHFDISLRHVHFIQKISSAGGTLSGYLIYHYDINSIFPGLFEFYSGTLPSHELYLVIGDHSKVHYSGKDNSSHSADVSQGNTFSGTLASTGRTGFFETRNFDGTPVFAVISDIPSLKANLVAQIDKSEADKLFRNDLLNFITLITGLLLAAFFVFLYLAARNRKKLNESEKEKKFILEQFEFVSNFSNEAILLFDGNFKLLYTNHKINSFFNITPLSLRNQVLGSLYKKITGSELDFNTLDTKKIVSSEAETISASGEPLFFEITCRKISNNINTIFHLNIKDITEKKKSIKDLENSEKRYRELTEAMSDFAFSLKIDSSGRIKLEWITESFNKISGYLPAERVGNQGFLYPVDPEDLEVLSARLITAVRNNSNIETEVRLTTKSAEIKHIKISLKPLPEEESGGVSSVLGLGRDITEEKRLQLEVQENSKKSELIFENSFEATLLVKDQQIELVNRSLLKLFGYNNPDEVLNKPVTTLVAPKHRNLIAAYLQKRAYSDTPHTTYFALGLKKDGSVFEAELSISHYSVGVGKYLIVMIRDISVKLETEKRIRESEEKYRTLANQVPVGIYRINGKGELLYYNKTFSDLFRLSAQSSAIQILNIADFYDDSYVHEIKIKKIASTRDVYSADTVMVRADHENIYVKEKATGIFDETGNLLYIDGIIEDITEYKKINDRTIANYRLFKTIWDSSIEGFRLTDKNGKIVMVNDAFCRIFEKEQKEITGQVFTVCYENLDEGAILRYQARFNARNITPEFEVETRISNGKIKWLEISTSYIDIESDYPLLLTIFKDSTEKRKALELLKQNEQRFRNLAMTLPVGILIYDKNKSVVFCNHSASKIFGLPTENIIGTSYLGRYSAIYDKNHNLITEESLPTAVAFSTKHSVLDHEIGLIFKGRTDLKWVKVNSIPQLDEFGEINNVIVSIDDITDEKNTLDEIRKLMKGIEQSPVSVVITNADGVIEYVNPFFTEVTGFTFEEAMGQKLPFLKSGLQDDEYYNKLWQDISSGRIWKGELQNKKKNGDIYWESVSISPIHDEQNRITHYVAVKDDITEQRKAAEELIRYQNNLVDKLKKLELIQLIYSKYSLTTDVKEIFTGINDLLPRYYSCDLAVIKLEDPENKKLYGIEKFGLKENSKIDSVSGILDKYEKECLSSDKPIVVDEASARELFPDDYVTHPELKALVFLRIRYKNDPIGILEVFYTEKELSLKSDDIEFLEMVTNLLGILIANALSFENLMETRNNLLLAKERAEEMNRIKSTFLANLSHELRTPLINIIGYAEIIMDSVEEDEELKMMADSIYKGGTRLKDTLNSLLELSKLEANTSKLNLVDVNVEMLLDETLLKNSHKAEEKGLYMNKESLIADPVVKSDPLMLESIIEHLISNAIKYTEEGGVSLELYDKVVQGEECFILRVSDTGIGISEENQTKIFEDFRQASEGYSRQYEGAGIGLAIVSKYCKILKGTIEVESEPGVGTAFTVTIPKKPKSY